MQEKTPNINPRPVRRERPYRSINGYGVSAVALLLIAVGVWAMVQRLMPLPMSIVLVVVGLVLVPGLYMLQPNEGIILTLFGEYQGTDRSEGLRWTNPLQSGQKISLRARNLNTPPLKVNDKRGNPVEIGAAVVWRVYDTAQAVFEIDDYNKFVAIQAEAAIRHLATLYAYDSGDDLPSDETTLRAGLDTVADALRDDLNRRFASAGVEVLDAKLTHLAYAPEIAQVMLRRQQAVAIVSAAPDRGRCGRHGRGCPQGPVGAQPGRARRRAQGIDGVEPAGGAVLRPRDSARGEHRYALHLRREPYAPSDPYSPDGQSRQESLSPAHRSGPVGRDRAPRRAGTAQRERAGRVPAARGAGPARAAAGRRPGRQRARRRARRASVVTPNPLRAE